MKKLIAAVALAALTGTAFAQLAPLSGVTIDKNTSLPVHWLAQGQPKDKAAVKTVLLENGKSKSVTFAPTIHVIDFFGNTIDMEAGDEFTLTVKIKGKGKVNLAYFGYKTNNQYLFFHKGKDVILTGEEQTISEKFTVKNGKDYPTGKIRPSIRINKDTVCEITSITLTEE